MAIRRPPKTGPPRASLTPISGSLPITMLKPKPLPSISSIFGRKNEVVSKSWSDLWDEDIEEEEEEAEKQLKARQMQNARTWSHESRSEDDTVRQGQPLDLESSSIVNIQMLEGEAARTTANDIDGDIVADGFFFHDTPTPAKAAPQLPPRYSPPSKRNPLDKWSALGERRRAYVGASESEKSPELWKSRRNVGLGFTGFGAAIWGTKANTVINDKGKECPWRDHRVRDRHARRSRDRQQVDSGDLEWVGGWNNLHL